MEQHTLTTDSRNQWLSRQQQHIALPRAFFQQIIDLAGSLGPTWGVDDAKLVSERFLGVHRIRIYLQEIDRRRWSLILEAEPPFSGFAELLLGDDLYRIPFDIDGYAGFIGLPGDVLAAHGEPDIIIAMTRDL